MPPLAAAGTMSESCEGCAHPLEPEWVACPYCGRPSVGRGWSEKLVRTATKVGTDLLEQGLLEAETKAQQNGNRTRAAQLELARQLAKDVAPRIAEAVTTYLYQTRTPAPPPRKSLPSSRPRRA
jgi:hypothetical protein